MKVCGAGLAKKYKDDCMKETGTSLQLIIKWSRMWNKDPGGNDCYHRYNKCTGPHWSYLISSFKSRYGDDRVFFKKGREKKRVKSFHRKDISVQ